MNQYSKINTNLSLIFLFIILLFAPFYKYCENVLFFPRINISLLYITIFLILVLYNIYHIDKKTKEDLWSSFGLLLMISLIQIISYPWAITYMHNGAHIYLTIISKTIIQAWLFWFAGLYIVEILNNDRFWKYMSFLWFAFVCIIISNAMNNQSFLIVLNGNPIYLMLADSFAMLSIFILCKSKNYKIQLIIIILSIICLLALWSRAALYCYMLTMLLFLYKNRNIYITIISIIFFIFIYVNIDMLSLVDERMTRLLYGTYDVSQNMREDQLKEGIKDLKDVWILGSFMGDIEQNFGSRGNYIHNYLSFWRQYGFIPFIIFVSIIVSRAYRITKYWIFEEKEDIAPLFLFYFTIFCLSEIIIARSFVFPYIWLSISGISFYFNNYKQVS
ncbi:MAG: hypothetical protein CMG25_05330 [Candidatus Marinimicrobia bacterium]|nr:hypothetical protein [Candidatus Neomarinimicrobiota bacterium]